MGRRQNAVSYLVTSWSRRTASCAASLKEQLNLDASADFTLFHQFTSLGLKGASLCLWELNPKSSEPSCISKGCLNVLWLRIQFQNRCRQKKLRSAIKLKICMLPNVPLRYWVSAAYLSQMNLRFELFFKKSDATVKMIATHIQCAVTKLFTECLKSICQTYCSGLEVERNIFSRFLPVSLNISDFWEWECTTFLEPLIGGNLFCNI